MIGLAWGALRRFGVIDTSVLVFAGLAAVTGGLTLALHGGEAVRAAMAGSLGTMLDVLPQIGAGLLIGGLAQQLVPASRVEAALGRHSGLRGIMLASLIGMVTPGGPFTSFPLVYALAVAGADAGTLVAYITAWSMVGVNRLLIWEIPFMGWEFGTVRFLSSLPAPILAGLLARQIVRWPGLALVRMK